MKINVVKLIIVLGISALLGLLCFEIAKEEGLRNWISFATSAVSILLCLGSAMGVDYNRGYRSVNIKVTACFFSVFIILANFIFSCFLYNIAVYIAVISILVLMDIAIIFALSKPQGR